MPFITITKPVVGDPTKKSLIDDIIDDLTFLNGELDAGNNVLLGKNSFFENDADSDGDPDGWDFTDFIGGTHALFTSAHLKGKQSQGFTSTVLANGGGEAIDKDYSPVEGGETYPWKYARQAGSANVSCKAEVVWYDNTKTLISTSLLNQDTNTPTTLTRINGSVTAPSTARYARRKITGGVPAVGTAIGITVFDNFVLMELAPIAQANIATSAVGQAELKSTTGIVSTSAGPVNLTLPGGEYGFYPQVRGTATSFPGATAYIAIVAPGSSYVTNINLKETGTLGTPTAYAQQRYIQASPPYNLGDGDIPVFLFAVVDNATRAVISTYIAADPPWANNGPTDIRPDIEYSGKAFKKMRLIFQEYGTLKAALADGLTRQEIFNRLANDPIVDAEITQALKQSDMPMIPHPFPDYDIANQTVVMLDPVSNFSDRMRMLHDMNDEDFSFGELMHKGFITFGNADIGAKAPPGVMPVSASWKLTR